MPSKSKQQQKFMGIVRAIQKGEEPAGKFSKAAQKAAKSMKKSSVRKYAKTKHDDLPKKVKEEKKRDYKAEYKKFQSSTKAKKYRAELNKYNRKKGTYGNGDGKDASHKGGKIVGFESQSKNRGRAEKSRLKKEAKLNENPAAIAAAQRMVVQAKAGKKVSVNTARRPSYAKKDPSAHNKAKSMWQRIKDRFAKKEMLEATYGQMLAKKGKKLNVVFVNGKPKVQIVDLQPVEEYSGFSGMSKWQRDRLDQRSKEKAPKGKKVSNALQKKRDAWAKKYYTKGGGINIAKWKKDGSPRFPKESVNEAVSPKGWNMSKKYISFIDREVKKLKKYHMQQNEEDFLEVANYIELQLKQMKKDLNESVNERTDSQAKKNLMRALKNSKVSHAYSYDNDQIAMEMTNDETYIIGNIRRYEDD